MNATLQALLSAFDALPPLARAALIAWAVSITSTQPLKFLLPLAWSSRARNAVAQAAAFGSALGAMVAQVPTTEGWLVGLLVGVWSPAAYYLFIRLIEKRAPWLADALSADVRGVLLGQRRAADTYMPRPDPKDSP